MKNKILQFIILKKYSITIFLVDILLFNLAIFLPCFLLRNSQPTLVFYIFATFIWLFIGSLFLLYSTCRYAIRHIILAIITTWIMLNLTTIYVDVMQIDKVSLLFMLPFIVTFILTYRYALRCIFLSKQNMDKKKEVKALIIGVSEDAAEIAEQLSTGMVGKYRVAGFLYLDSEPQKGVKVDPKAILGNTKNLYSVVKNKEVDEVIIALSPDTPFLYKRVESIIRHYSELHINFKVSSHLYDKLIGRIKMNHISELKLFDILPNTDHSSYLIYKRMMDVVVSLIGSIIFSPIMLLIAVITAFFDRGPVLYRQVRLGKLGKPFMLYKFRSMIPDAEKLTGPVWTIENDNRVTPFGRFLRKNSLDELPQLWNVLRGDMSLVGPRPERPYFVHNNKELQGRRLNIKPGMTGIAQINGRYGLNIRHKSKYDYVYLKNCSIMLDVRILLQTLEAVISKRGAR